MDLLISMKVLNRVWQLNGFSAAARDLSMSKSTVSRHVSDLESKLGVRLINRNTRRISLTEAGEVYARRSSDILEDIRSLQDETQGLHNKPSGKLRISSVVTFGQRKVVPIIPEYLAKYPKVSLELYLDNRVADVIEEGFDLAIRAAGSTDLRDSSLISRKLAMVEMSIYASTSYLDRFGQPTTPEELSDHCCITYPGEHDPSVWYFSHGKREYSVSVSGRFKVNSAEAAVKATFDSVGIGLLPTFMVGNNFGERVHELLTGYNKRGIPIYAIYPHKSKVSAKVRTFVDHLAMSLREGL